MLCVLCLIVLWGFSLVTSYSGVIDTAVTAHTLQIPVLRTSDTEEAHVVTRGVRRSRKRPMHSRDVTSPSALDMLRLHCIVLSARDVFACFHPGS